MTRRRAASRLAPRAGISRVFSRAALVALAAASFSRAVPAQAEEACAAVTGLPHAAGAAPRNWPSPLDRKVSLRGRELSLRDALDRVAAGARVRLSYAAELLPLDRRVCTAFDGVPVGEALTALVVGALVEPVVAGPDQIVLAPARHVADTVMRPARAADVLERVVVTGSATGASERPLTVALDVVSGKRLAERNATTISAALDEAVPGMWVWSQSPSSLLARYGSIRGASSFGVSYPKIYIDGIEVANPLLLTQIDPNAIERIEVIRGPQGAALYGADAISGVVNIVSRHDGASPDGARLDLQSGLGMSNSAFASPSVLAQTYGASMHLGSATRSAGLGMTFGSIGQFIPGGESRSFAAHGDSRLVFAKTTVVTTGRFFAQNAGSATSPLLAGFAPVHAYVVDGRANLRAWRPSDAPDSSQLLEPNGEPQRVRQYTIGSTATFAPDDRWTHSIVAGADGYRLANVAFDGGPIPSATDSALSAARGSADRLSFRASSVARLGDEATTSGTITFAAEHSVLREATVATLGPGALQQISGGHQYEGGAARLDDVAAWRRSTGVVAQGSASIRNTLYLTGGVRFERDAGYATSDAVNTLPMIGAAVVRDFGPATLKLRAAYGKGIRPPRTSLREATWMTYRRELPTMGLSPEVQSGIESGADLLLGSAFALHVTRFDQRASGLIQAVAIATLDTTGADPSGHSGPSGPYRRVAYQLQNVGEIDNRGWEMQGTARSGRFSLGGALALTDSKVARVTSGYTGDLRAGDRMLEVPARTASLTAGWTSTLWSTSWTAARASDWINYDRLALANDLAVASENSHGPGEYVGSRLRNYWKTYDGVTRLRATATRDLRRGFSVVAVGENLLNYQRGEPDDITIVPGRTITLGLRLKF